MSTILGELEKRVRDLNGEPIALERELDDGGGPGGWRRRRAAQA